MGGGGGYELWMGTIKLIIDDWYWGSAGGVDDCSRETQEGREREREMIKIGRNVRGAGQNVF